MRWRLKGVIQKVLGALPGGEALHFQFQRRLGGLRDLRREYAMKLDDWQGMVEQLHAHGHPIVGATLVEIGSGWYPTLPLALHLAGAHHVHTCDLNRLLKPDLMRACVALLGADLPRIARVAGVPLEDVQARYAALRRDADTPEAMTGGAVHYHAPCDVAALPLADGSVDIVFSNSVLEHVPPQALPSLHGGARRLLRPGGAAFHSVNCGDHYAYVDPTLHQLHYLRYSDAEWAFWNNRFLYQNRLRAHELVDGARAAGLQVVHDTSQPRPARLAQLQAMTVAPQFAGIPPEQLCITTVDFIARAP